MRRLRQIREHRHYELLKNSVEQRYNRRVAITVSIFTVVLLLLAIAGVSSLRKARSVMTFILVLFVLVPYCLYCIYRAVIPFFCMDSYSFTEALLDKPHSWGRTGMYFTVTLRDRMGRELQADTHAIFGFHSEPILEDYINQRALIAYNEKTETVVVIRRIPEAK